METTAKMLPIEDLPDISTKEALQNLINEKRAQLAEMKDTLKVFIWCVDFEKIKPHEMATFNWVDANIDSLIGKNNNIGRMEVFIYKLETWLKNWDNTTVVKGFQQPAEPDETEE